MTFQAWPYCYHPHAYTPSLLHPTQPLSLSLPSSWLSFCLRPGFSYPARQWLCNPALRERREREMEVVKANLIIGSLWQTLPACLAVIYQCCSPKLCCNYNIFSLWKLWEMGADMADKHRRTNLWCVRHGLKEGNKRPMEKKERIPLCSHKKKRRDGGGVKRWLSCVSNYHRMLSNRQSTPSIETSMRFFTSSLFSLWSRHHHQTTPLFWQELGTCVGKTPALHCGNVAKEWRGAVLWWHQIRYSEWATESATGCRKWDHRAPCRCQDRRVAHQLPQTTQNSPVQSSPRLYIVIQSLICLFHYCLLYVLALNERT